MMPPIQKGHPHVGMNKLEFHNFLLNTNRNLLITLAATFSLMIFATTADGLNDKAGKPGYISVVNSVIGLLIMLVSSIVHGVMVYQHANVILMVNWWWFALPGLVFLAGWVSIIMYLIAIFT